MKQAHTNTNKITLSPLIAGTMNWGVWDKNLSTNEMENRIQLCLENKITSFDHADIYGDYTTEAAFGKAFALSKIDRTQIQLISKCGIQLPTKNRNTTIKHYNYTKQHIIWSAENTLKNLATDYLDVFLLHRPSPLMQSDEIAEAVAKLQAEGKIKKFGLSNFTSSQTELIRQNIPIDYNQIQFSASQPEAITNGSLDYMQLHHIRPMAWNPLGTLFREDNQASQPLKKTIDQLAFKYGLGPDGVALSWILHHPAQIIPVVGTVNPSRIQTLMRATELQLEKEDWFAIWSQGLGQPVP